MYGTLIVKPVHAELEHSHGLFGKMNPFVVVRVGQSIFRSQRAHHGNKHPSWSESIQVPIRGETILHLSIFDKDTVTYDDFLCEAMVNLGDVFGRRSTLDAYPLRKAGKEWGRISVGLEWIPDSNQPSPHIGTNSYQTPNQFGPTMAHSSYVSESHVHRHATSQVGFPSMGPGTMGNATPHHMNSGYMVPNNNYSTFSPYHSKR